MVPAPQSREKEATSLSLAAGREFYQCGELDGDIAVIFVKKTITDDQAFIEIELIQFAIVDGTAVADQYQAQNLKDAKSAKVFGKTIRGDATLFNLSCNPYSVSFWVNAAEPTCTAVTLATDYEADSTKWTVTSADDSVNVTAYEKDDTLTFDGVENHCYAFSGSFYDATGESTYGSMVIYSTDAATGLADLDGKKVTGIAFGDSTSCQQFFE